MNKVAKSFYRAEVVELRASAEMPARKALQVSWFPERWRCEDGRIHRGYWKGPSFLPEEYCVYEAELCEFGFSGEVQVGFPELLCGCPRRQVRRELRKLLAWLLQELKADQIASYCPVLDRCPAFDD